MSTKREFGNEVSVGGEAYEQSEDEFEVVDETPEFRPSVEQEIQAKVDYADERTIDEGRLFGQTLEAEERMQAREWEVERTRVRFDRREDSDREERCRKTVKRVSVEKRIEFQKRAASVDRWQDPDARDPREALAQEELAAVNKQAMRMAEELDGWSRAAISRRLAERILEGADVPSAVVGVFEELRKAPGQVIPIALVPEVSRREVDVEGEVTVLWEPSHPRIQQVGLIEDETGRIKFTSWVRSDQPVVREGERVRFRSAAKNWYEGRCSIALTGWSSVTRLKEGRLNGE